MNEVHVLMQQKELIINYHLRKKAWIVGRII
jgi:hypothetical protein